MRSTAATAKQRPPEAEPNSINFLCSTNKHFFARHNLTNVFGRRRSSWVILFLFTLWPSTDLELVEADLVQFGIKKTEVVGSTTVTTTATAATLTQTTSTPLTERSAVVSIDAITG